MDVDAAELLRRLCIGDPGSADGGGELWSDCLDQRTRALITLGALIALSAPETSIRTAIDAAIAAGARAEEVIATLDGLVPVVGLPHAVAAASRIASALGYADELCVDDRP